MSTVAPTYTLDNCRSAYQLNWSLSVFWNADAPPVDKWLEGLRLATELDGVRILEHQFANDNVSQFLLSTKPAASPAMAIRSVKGRLQHLVRAELPKAFRRNYSLHSTGTNNAEKIEQYIESQLDRHAMGDKRIQERLAQHQIHDATVNLTNLRSSAYGQFVYNLHIVLVHGGRGIDVREPWLLKTSDTLRRVAQKKNHRLSRAGLLADHLHLSLGCNVTEAPAEVALAYMNNLAYIHSNKAVFQFGFYVGTFGNYDLNAVRH